MYVKRVIINSVKKCYDCPYFCDHPHEPSCDLKEKLSSKYPEYKGYGDLCDRHEIDKRCPIKLGRYKC